MVEIDKTLINKITEQAKNAPRKRINYNFHSHPGDTLQRMLNALCANTYIRPHKHENPDKRKAFVILQGSVLVVEFDDTGEIFDNFVLDPTIGNFGAEIQPGRFHTLISLSENSVVYEVKDGPYDVSSDKIFAEWALEDGSPECAIFNSKLISFSQQK
jgi:cupin fold WbuC family metalloprotein